MAPQGFQDKVAFVWRVADKLRGTFKQHEYGSVMLPLLVLRRMDAVLAPTKDAVLAMAKGFTSIGGGEDALLKKASGHRFYNTAPWTFQTLLNDDRSLAENLAKYIRKLSPDAYRVMEAYNFDVKIDRLDRAGLLYAVMADFADLDLRPSVVSNETMGYIFEELLRKFSEMSNETAGEHYTPREVITLMVDLLLTGQATQDLTENPIPVRKVYDPAAGTGGMLMGAMHQIRAMNPKAIVRVFGQELNDETWAIAQSDLMIQDVDPAQMRNGNTLKSDAFPSDKFDFILANPPYGVDWKGYAAEIRAEHEKFGHQGRFGAGLPRVSDGSLLFLQHMLSKMKPTGSRVAIVLSGSPLFSGQAGSGESEIRRWIFENDWLEGIVALPDQMFYNTGISTYVWILTNDKSDADRGLVRLIDARELGSKMRKSLGDKRKELTTDAIAEITQLYGGALGEFADEAKVKVLPNEAFGFQRITVERPLRRRWEVTPDALEALANSKPWHAWQRVPSGEPVETRNSGSPTEPLSVLIGRRFATAAALTAEIKRLEPAAPLPVVRELVKLAAVSDPEAPIVKGKHGPEPDPDLRDAENIPLPDGWLALDDKAREKALIQAAEAHLLAEIHPYVPDAWIDHAKTKIGFEIPFTRQFYVNTPPRPVAEIAAEIKDLEAQIQDWLKELGL